MAGGEWEGTGRRRGRGKQNQDILRKKLFSMNEKINLKKREKENPLLGLMTQEDLESQHAGGSRTERLSLRAVCST